MTNQIIENDEGFTEQVNCLQCKDLLVKGTNWRPNNGSPKWKYCTKCVRSRTKHVSYGHKIGFQKGFTKGYQKALKDAFERVNEAFEKVKVKGELV